MEIDSSYVLPNSRVDDSRYVENSSEVFVPLTNVANIDIFVRPLFCEAVKDEDLPLNMRWGASKLYWLRAVESSDMRGLIAVMRTIEQKAGRERL